MAKLRIGILFGGSTEEHPVSVKSAREVAKHLDSEKYEPFYIGITQSGAWKLCEDPDEGWETATARARSSSHRTAARTGFWSWSREATRRSAWT